MQQQTPQWQAHQEQGAQFADNAPIRQQPVPQNTAAAQHANAEITASALSAGEVGAAFAVQYFKIMKNRPEDLHRFYSTNCRITRSSCLANGSSEHRTAASPAQVRELLLKEHGCGAGLSVAMINVMECQDSIAGSVFIHLTGVLRFVDETSKNFTMSIVLGREDTDGLEYFIYNDCLVFCGPPEYESARPTTYSTVTATPLAPPTTSQATTPCPAGALAAATGQPSVAPLPTTTAPRLSGAASPVAEVPQVEQQQADVVETVAVVAKELEAEKVEEQKPAENTATESSPPASTTAGSTAVKSVWQSMEPVEVKEDVFAVKSPAKPAEPQQQQPSSSSSSTVRPAAVPAVEPANYSRNSYAGALVHSGSLQTTRVGYSVPRPAGSASTAQTKPATPVEESRDSRRGSGQQNRPANGTAPRQERPASARGKTLWVSVIPVEMTDEKMKKAIAEQLRGQATEGHVVRIERVPGHVHGYIELDTEACAKLLLERGLHLQGREVTIDYPNRGNAGANRPAGPRGSRPRRPTEGGNVSPVVTGTTGPTPSAPRRNNRGPRRSEVTAAPASSVTPAESVEEGWTNAGRRRPKRNGAPGGNATHAAATETARNTSGPSGSNRRRQPAESGPRRNNNMRPAISSVPRMTDSIVKPVAQPVN